MKSIMQLIRESTKSTANTKLKSRTKKYTKKHRVEKRSIKKFFIFLTDKE